jgi:hypothetical protein
MRWAKTYNASRASASGAKVLDEAQKEGKSRPDAPKRGVVCISDSH